MLTSCRLCPWLSHLAGSKASGSTVAQGRTEGSDSECEGGVQESAFGDIPTAVVEDIFKYLSPRSLGFACCVCRYD